jgi:hypothetical protein
VLCNNINKIKIPKRVNMPLFCNGVKVVSHLKAEHGLREFEDRVLRKMVGPKK